MTAFLGLVILAQSFGGVAPDSSGGNDLQAKVLADNEIAMFFGGMGNLSPAKEKVAGAMVANELKRWGCKGNDALVLLRDFNNLIGIDNTPRIRRETLTAACVGSRAVATQKSWKKAVAGYALRESFPRFTDENKAKAKVLLDQLSALTPSVDARYKTSIPKPEKDPLLAKVKESYQFFGVMSEGDTLTIANYRFLILSGTSEDAGKKDLFDATTYAALKSALQSFADGKDWRVQN
ncbi:MAG: hypothetical protein NT099_09170 [Candidatus Saganbacteria bacterium]|nr:hypothetical protein [Candidatus Saganbacteria bacterium]